MLFMVLMAQGSHFVEAMDHPVVAVEAEHVLVKAVKAAHKASDRNAKAVKAELQGSLSTPADADSDMHAGKSVAGGANQVVAPSPSRGANTSLTEPLSVLSGNSHGTSNAGSLATPTPQLSSHVTRRLVVATVQCVGLDEAMCGTNLDAALSGTADEVVLQDGTYAGSTFTIDRDVTLRAQNVGQAVLDGENTRRVMTINSGTVIVEGLSITKGSVRCPFHEPSSDAPSGRNYPELTCDDRFPPRRICHGISAHCRAACTLPFPQTFFRRPRRKKLP